jgi:hypothetical protein
VNAIFRGMIDTPVLQANPASMMSTMTECIPLRRAGTTDELTSAVLCLSSPAASYVTGAEFTVDGASTADASLQLRVGSSRRGGDLVDVCTALSAARGPHLRTRV